MNSGSRSNYLLKNTAIFAIGNISTKLIHFFLVPLYTYVLTTEEYGTIDLVVSICSILVPILMCNIGEAIRRYLLDEDSDENKIKTVEYIWAFVGLILSCLIYFIMSHIPSISEYAFWVCAFSFTNALSQITLEYLRGQEKLKLYTVWSTYSSLAVALLNVLFLAKMHMGIKGYFLAYIISYFTMSICAFISSGQYKGISNLVFEKKLFVEMSLFSIALVPNSIMWWITNSSDRIMVTYLISAAANGIYSVSYKLPSLLSTLSTILMQAWQYSAIKEEKSEDREDYQNNMFKLYLTCTAIISAGLLFILKPFMKIYVAQDYFVSWKYSPFLIIGLMFQTLATFVGTSYYVKKNMKGNLYSSSVGAITNIILNIILIPMLGVNGAAIATCISYVAVLVFRLYDTRRYLNIRYFTSYNSKITIIMIVMLLAVYLPSFYSYVAMALCIFLLIYVSRDIYLDFVKKVFKRIR